VTDDPKAHLDDLAQRIELASQKSDQQRVARLELERALAHEWADDPDTAAESFARAAKANPELLAAVREARRAALDLDERVEWLDRELDLDGRRRGELLVERARALEASGADGRVVVEAWQAARAALPEDDEVLIGLEAALLRSSEFEELTVHWTRLSRASVKDASLAASYQCARGRAFEARGDDAAAEEAYAEALVLEDVPGPAREGLRRSLLRRKSFGKLVALLVEDADRDPSARVRRLYEAARIAEMRLDDPSNAIALLTRARDAAPSYPALDARVIEELVRLLEEQGDVHAAAAARKDRIAFETEAPMRAVEERRLALELEAMNDLNGAVDALERARAIEPLDEVSLAMLDRLLATLGRDEDRVGLWIAEATRAPDGLRGARAYVRAASIAEDTLGRSDDALKMLRSAWATRPGDEDALDAQLRILARSTNEEEKARRAAAVDLLVRAADLTQDPALRIAHLEKAATILEEYDPARAAELYNRVLALSPTRRFAVVALQRVLHRAGDHAALAAMLEREAEQTSDPEHAATLRLRAAEVFHRDANNIERAVALLRRILDVRPDHEGALLALLACHEQTGRLDDAREALRKLLPLRWAEAVPQQLAIAELSRRVGDSEGVIAALREVLAAAPDHPIALRDLARVLRRERRWEEAAEATLAVDPVLAGELFEWRVGDDERAAAAYARANEPAAFNGLCRIAERRRDVPSLEKLYARDEFRLADLLLRTGGDPARAATLLGGHADDVDSVRTLYEACVRAGDEDSVFSALAAFAAKTTDPRAKHRAHVQRFRSKGAISDALAAKRLFPDDLRVRGFLADAAEGDERIAALEALTNDERDPSCRFLLHLRLAALLDEKRALPHALSALELDPASPTAAAMTISVATKLGDRAARLRGERVAAEIARDTATRTRHLLTGASLAREIEGQDAVATELIDAALAADPDSVEASTAATQHLIGRDPATLLSLLYRAAFATQKGERIVALAREAASLADALGEHDRAAALLGRARSFDPRNVGVLVDLGDVLRHQGAWAEAGRAYDEAIASGSETSHRELLARAHRAIAELAEGPFSDPLRAIVSLRAVIRLEPNDLDAQRRLAAVLGRQGQPLEADQILTAIAQNPQVEKHVRLATLDQLCELRLANKDKATAEQALRERVKLDPALRGESWTKLEEFHKQHMRADESLADTLNELVVDASADPSWLLELADIELRLGRERAAILHLRMASKMGPDDVRPLVALAGALLAIAENDEAAKVLHQLVQRDPTNAEVLAARERALLGSSAREEALVVSELRAWLGQVDDSGRFRSRRVHPNAPREGVLDDTTLVKSVLPRGAPHAVFNVLRVVARAVPKLSPPQPLSAYGLSSRDRLTSKSGHPLRLLVDRLCVALGLEKIEVYVHNANDGAVEIEPHDPPSLIVPSYLLSLAEMEVVFAVARALARFALGGYAIDKLGARGIAAAIAAAVAPLGGTLPVVDAEDIERRITKALDRHARKSLEPLAPNVKPFDPEALIRAVEQGAIRVAYLLSGDLGSALTNVRRRERIHVGELGREGTSTGDLIRFALGDESVALRKQLGITWASG